MRITRHHYLVYFILPTPLSNDTIVHCNNGDYSDDDDDDDSDDEYDDSDDDDSSDHIIMQVGQVAVSWLGHDFLCDGIHMLELLLSHVAGEYRYKITSSQTPWVSRTSRTFPATEIDEFLSTYR
jgi:hypothetical protein